MDPSNNTQLINSFKYLSKFLPPAVIVYFGAANVREGTGFYFFLAANIFATTFVTGWDYYMDWGLFRSNAPNRKYLRDQITFKPKFYYQAMVFNIITRHAWVLPMIHIKYFDNTANLGLFGYCHPLILSLMIIEGVRRWVWAIIRVENESLNNFEEYRSINTIPPIKEESDSKS